MAVKRGRAIEVVVVTGRERASDVSRIPLRIVSFTRFDQERARRSVWRAALPLLESRVCLLFISEALRQRTVLHAPLIRSLLHRRSILSSGRQCRRRGSPSQRSCAYVIWLLLS